MAFCSNGSGISPKRSVSLDRDGDHSVSCLGAGDLTRRISFTLPRTNWVSVVRIAELIFEPHTANATIMGRVQSIRQAQNRRQLNRQFLFGSRKVPQRFMPSRRQRATVIAGDNGGTPQVFSFPA